MPDFDAGEVWEASVDALRVTRWTATTGGATLVTLKVANDGEATVAVQVVEEVPETVTAAVPITTAGDDADAWRYVGNWIVHEFAVPVDGERTTAYVLESDHEPPVAVEPPEINAVDEVDADEEDDGGDVADEEAARGESAREEPTEPTVPGAGVDRGVGPADHGRSVASKIDEGMRKTTDGAPAPEVAAPESAETGGPDRPPSKPVEPSTSGDTEADIPETAAGAGTERQPADGRASGEEATEPPGGTGDVAGAIREAEAAEAGDGAPIVVELLDALENDATRDQRRALRGHLGLRASERARIGHVQSRVDDLEVYIDALEVLVDEHGIEVVNDLRDAVEETASTADALRDRVEALEDDVERASAETEEAIDTVESEVAELRAGLAADVAALESSLEDARSDVDALWDAVRGDRHARAREVRRIERSFAEVHDGIERIEGRVRSCEAFQERFTKLLGSLSSPQEEGDLAGPIGGDPASFDE